MAAMTERFPAGWYPNQLGAGYRFWDGARWTEHYLQSGEPLVGRPESPPEEIRQPGAVQQRAGTSPQAGETQTAPAAQAQTAQGQPAQQPETGYPAQPAQPAQPQPAQPQAPVQPQTAGQPQAPVQPQAQPQSPPYYAQTGTGSAFTPPRPAVQVAAGLLAVIAGIAALLVAISLPHSSTETLVSGGYYVKAPYYFWLLIGGGESILLGLGLLIITTARVRAGWLTPLTVAAAALGAVLFISAAIVFVSYSTARDDNLPAPAPNESERLPDSQDLLQEPMSPLRR